MRTLLILFFLSVVQGTVAQEKLTTFILVRHAEKNTDGSQNPDLSETGKARAQALARLLRESKVAAIYATPYKRTQQTVEPLSSAKSLTVQTYNPMKMEDIEKMLQEHAGETIVVCGHSNTTPWVANKLTGSTAFTNWDESDYDNVLVVTVSTMGNGTVTWLSY